ncbi:Type II secretion system (T2SS), protein F [Acididesulfobacillus acetoxydans]|uniref:Type II secretion system (T2SS), protein F n=1 Tax=Acididesulfobacillus acetoxydans TaxID=1561005 RepID=A0A8S0Y347_9FIRM|nr:type II secretion system F family protein [Acididesulfobacillus acetoxydans]CAA7601595.1 Type II secretion system (T2SS), protein F [Acididesulfobacillus acetoxydans]CEJ07082.1 Type II secretory pathway, component PulF [Acididesulfobacillus acetoxydans]
MKRASCVWKAVDASGAMHRGIWEIADPAQTRALLFKCGYFPVSIRRRRPVFPPFLFKDTKSMWSGFVGRLSALLAAGIPLLQALDIVVLQEDDPSAETLWRQLREKVASGNDLSAALSALDCRLPLYALAMLRGGEHSGDIISALKNLAEELDQERNFTRKIQGALGYPLLLSGAALGVLYAMGMWVLPVYERLFRSLQADLPWPTRVIFLLARHLSAFSLVSAAAPPVLLLYFRLRYGEEWLGRIRGWLGRLPLLKKVYRLRELLHFSRVMGMLLQAGVTLDKALDVAEGTAESGAMNRMITHLKEGVRQGRTLVPILRADDLLPVAAREMLGVGEEAGQWDKMFNHVADMLGAELEELLDRAAKLLEPALILVLAGLIGVIAAGVLLPVFDLGTHLQ